MKRSKSENHKWNMADTVTTLRIAASVVLLFLPLPSAGFLGVYTLAGLTDALDGWLARKTGTASEFGAMTALRICCFTLFCCSGYSRFCGKCFRQRSGMPWQAFSLCGWQPMLQPRSNTTGLPRCIPG